MPMICYRNTLAFYCPLSITEYLLKLLVNLLCSIVVVSVKLNSLKPVSIFKTLLIPLVLEKKSIKQNNILQFAVRRI